MRRITLGVALAALAALLAALAAPVLAHEGGAESGVAVEPTDVTAGNTVIFTGTGLEASTDRTLVLVGGNLSIQLGTVTTTADGTFEQEITIPNYLPSGQYQLQAIGDETLSADVNVTAAPGGAASSAAPAAGETLTPRPHSAGELVMLGLLVLLIAALGVWLVWRAEWIGGRRETREA